MCVPWLDFYLNSVLSLLALAKSFGLAVDLHCSCLANDFLHCVYELLPQNVDKFLMFSHRETIINHHEHSIKFILPLS